MANVVDRTWGAPELERALRFIEALPSQIAGVRADVQDRVSGALQPVVLAGVLGAAACKGDGFVEGPDAVDPDTETDEAPFCETVNPAAYLRPYLEEALANSDGTPPFDDDVQVLIYLYSDDPAGQITPTSHENLLTRLIGDMVSYYYYLSEEGYTTGWIGVTDGYYNLGTSEDSVYKDNGTHFCVPEEDGFGVARVGILFDGYELLMDLTCDWNAVDPRKDFALGGCSGTLYIDCGYDENLYLEKECTPIADLELDSGWGASRNVGDWNPPN